MRNTRLELKYEIKALQLSLASEQRSNLRLLEKIDELEADDYLANLKREKSYWKIKYAEMKDREDSFSVDAMRLQREVDALEKVRDSQNLLKEIVSQ